jgi:hypothetical protein
MNVINPPPVGPGRTGRTPDDLDGLLRDYFEAELPAPWPGFQPPAVRQPAPRPRWQRVRSRLSLAASVALLLGGGLGLAALGPGADPQPRGSQGPVLGTNDRPTGPHKPDTGSGLHDPARHLRGASPAGNYR